MEAPLVSFLLLLLLSLSISCNANQSENLRRFIKLRKSETSRSTAAARTELDRAYVRSLPVHVAPQEGLKETDKIDNLPGQPAGVNFDQYAGYVTVDPNNERALFYYFVESPQNASTKPLVLWLNGGPGCSSLGYGAMEELGPFRVNSDGKTLYRNKYAWNNVANVIFLESPAGVGYSYSNTSSDYTTGDAETAKDSYTFLVNWLERFPQYKNRDFYITGESYAGHYVPQLAYTILSNNNNPNHTTIINLKGIAIGNPWVDDNTGLKGTYDYYWAHALNSDQTYARINKYCNFSTGNYTDICLTYQNRADSEIGNIDPYSIYAPICFESAPKPGRPGSVKDFDPCSDNYVESYLNLAEVQTAFHAKATKWEACSGKVTWTDAPSSVLPTIKQIMANGTRLWIYSGDVDSVVAVTTSKYAINSFNLPIKTAWRPWYTSKEVGGYVTEYKGLTFTTIRGAGHEVPSYQPERALTMFTYFLDGKPLPSS